MTYWVEQLCCSRHQTLQELMSPTPLTAQPGRSPRRLLIIGVGLSLTGTLLCTQSSGYDLSPLFVCGQSLSVLACVASLARLEPVGGEPVLRVYQTLRGVFFVAFLALSASETTHLSRFDLNDQITAALWLLGAAVLTWSVVQPPTHQRSEPDA